MKLLKIVFCVLMICGIAGALIFNSMLQYEPEAGAAALSEAGQREIGGWRNNCALVAFASFVGMLWARSRQRMEAAARKQSEQLEDMRRQLREIQRGKEDK